MVPTHLDPHLLYELVRCITLDGELPQATGILPLEDHHGFAGGDAIGRLFQLFHAVQGVGSRPQALEGLLQARSILGALKGRKRAPVRIDVVEHVIELELVAHRDLEPLLEGDRNEAVAGEGCRAPVAAALERHERLGKEVILALEEVDHAHLDTRLLLAIEVELEARRLGYRRAPDAPHATRPEGIENHKVPVFVVIQSPSRVPVFAPFVMAGELPHRSQLGQLIEPLQEAGGDRVPRGGWELLTSGRGEQRPRSDHQNEGQRDDDQEGDKTCRPNDRAARWPSFSTGSTASTKARPRSRPSSTSIFSSGCTTNTAWSWTAILSMWATSMTGRSPPAWGV